MNILETDQFEVHDLGIQEIDVYDIEVEETHNFFANEILVHNSVYIKLDDLVDTVFKDQTPSDNEVVGFVEKFHLKLKAKIDDSLEELYDITNAYDEKLNMSIESIGPAIWVAAKRYIMSLPSYKLVRYDPPKIKMQGIDAVRSSTPKVVRDYIEDAIPLLIEGDDQKIKNYIDEKRADFYSKGWEDVAFPRGTNDIQKYAHPQNIFIKGTPIHVRAVLLYNHMLKQAGLDSKYQLISPGDKIRFCYMRMPNPIRENVFAAPDVLPPEFNFEEFIDYEMQFQKTFLNPLTKIINAAGIDLTDDIDIDQFLV